jgi:hypothetical protein
MARAVQSRRPPKSPVAGWFERWWPYAIDLGLTLWVLRAPLAAVVVGFALLWLTPQAQDLLVELATPGDSIVNWFRIPMFYALLLFVWAMPTHYASRLLVNTDEGYRRRIARRRSPFIKALRIWMPRALGTAPFAAMLIAAIRSQRNLPHVAEAAYDHAALSLHLLFIALGILVLACLFLIYAIYRDRLADRDAVKRLEMAAAVPMTVVRHVSPRVTEKGKGVASNLGPLLLVGMTAVFVFLPLAFPEFFSRLFPRAASVPFIVGGWLPLLAYLSSLGRRFQVPFILLVALLLGFLPLVFKDNYQVRLINPALEIKSLTGHESKEIAKIMAPASVNDAIGMWKKANDCEQGPCPRPIIIAAAGGASRAGFFTAEFIGQLLDDQMRTGTSGHGLDTHDVINRIFALSTVSGSSVGAVMSVAAMAMSDGKQPCKAKSAPLWRGQTIDSWRSCLEALMSGDFLTPAFTGFTFRDLFGFLHWRDRAALLERSWEAQFHALIGGKPASTATLACVGSLECPFKTLRPAEDSSHVVHWLPLLVLNGTSVGSGQRIITTTLDGVYHPAASVPCPLEPRAKRDCPLFADAYLFHNFLTANPKLDVRLSTAAHNSARFPLISPPGEVTDGGGNVIDRIVDGGYFENFGAQTATELAIAMRAIDPKLRPFIVVLSNDPEIPPMSALSDEVNFDGSREALTDVKAPITAFSNTRNARGKLAVDEAIATLDSVDGGPCNLAIIKVWGEPQATDKADPNSKKGAGVVVELVVVKTGASLSA